MRDAAGRCRFVLALALLLLAGCAVGEKRNRLTLNAIDEHYAPDSESARWALAPLAVPVGLVALACDAVIVHPATVIDDAWSDTVRWLWTPDPAESRFRRALIVPLAALATPIVWLGDWLGRSAFAIPPVKDDP